MSTTTFTKGLVSSNLVPSVTYKEIQELDPEDVGHSSMIFQMDFVFDLPKSSSSSKSSSCPSQTIFITLGKCKKHYEHQLAYYPIYLVSSDNMVKYRIGLFELTQSQAITMKPEQLKHPLWFSFASELIQQETKKSSMTIQGGTTRKVYEEDDSMIMLGDELDEDGLPTVLDTNHFPKEIRAEGIFTMDLNQQHVVFLPIETKEESDAIVHGYSQYIKQERHLREQSNDSISWVEEFFKNPYYRIHTCEDNADSLFAVIRDAYANIGLETTVAKLRHLVAKHSTEAHYQYYVDKWNVAKDFLKRQQLRQSNTTRKQLPSTMTLSNHKGSMTMSKKKQSMILDHLLGWTIMEEYVLKSRDQFRLYLQKSIFPADPFILHILERLLQCKFVFLSELSNRAMSPYEVLECHHSIPESIQEPTFQPEHYIIMTYHATKRTYQLVSYKQKKLFRFEELPYHMKSMIQIRVLEGNAGIFPWIHAFQKFQSSLGIRPIVSSKELSTVMIPKRNLHQVIFTFHSKSREQCPPGHGMLEQIPVEAMLQFQKLDKIPYWRRKLEDSWTDEHDPIVIEEKSYASVNHYMEAMKYIHLSNGNISHQFSIDSGSKLSKDLKLFKDMEKQRLLQQQTTMAMEEPELLPDIHYEMKKNMYYKKALEAKFQKTEMQMLLQSTQQAILQRYIPRQVPKVHTLLMEIRNSIITSKTPMTI